MWGSFVWYWLNHSIVLVVCQVVFDFLIESKIFSEIPNNMTKILSSSSAARVSMYWISIINRLIRDSYKMKVAVQHWVLNSWFFYFFCSFFSFHCNTTVARGAAKAAEKETYLDFQSYLRTSRDYGHFGEITSYVLCGRKVQRISPVGNLFWEKGYFELCEGGDSQWKIICFYFWSKWFRFLLLEIDWF